MSFKYFKLQRVKNLLSPTISNNLESPDRRRFVKTMGFGVLATNPILKTFTALNDKAFEINYNKKYFSVVRDEKIVWEISPNLFGDNLHISVDEKTESILINAKNLQFVHTELFFDLEASLVNNSSDWVMHFKIPQLGIDKKIDFIHFIDSIQTIESSINSNTTLLSLTQTDGIRLQGDFDCEINNHWDFIIKKPKGIKTSINNSEFTSGKLTITQNQSYFNTILSKELSQGIRIVLEDNISKNSLLENIIIDNNYTLQTYDNAAINISMGIDSQNTLLKSLWITNNNSNLFVVDKNMLTTNLEFNSYFYLLNYTKNNTPDFFLSAKMGIGEQWIHNSLGSFSLTASPEDPELEIRGKGNKSLQYKIAPKFNSFQPIVAGAVSLPSFIDDEKLHIVGKYNKSIKNEKEDHILSYKQDNKIEFTPKKPIKIKVLRPDDMVFLEFEFHNFKFTGLNLGSGVIRNDNIRVQPRKPINNSTKNKVLVAPVKTRKNITLKKSISPIKRTNISGIKSSNTTIAKNIVEIGKSYTPVNYGNLTGIEIDDKNKKAYVVVYFPTQHTIEEAFYETNAKLNDSGTSDTVKLPVKHLRAKKSRLVYELKSNINKFNLDIEELLDWSKFKLKIDPRAWITLNSIPKFQKPTYTIPTIGKKLPDTRAKYLDKNNMSYAVKVLQKDKLKTNKDLVYNSSQLQKVFISTDLKPIQVSTKIIDYRVKSIDRLNTSIEAPALLYISPNQVNDFHHKISIEKVEDKRSVSTHANELIPVGHKTNNLRVKPVSRKYQLDRNLDTSQGEIVELWHTHLGVKMKDGSFSSSLSKLKTIRALWAFDASPKVSEDQNRNKPFRSALDANNRHKLVHITSNYQIPNYKPQPVQVDRLILSNLGAYINWHAKFKKPASATNLNIVEWEHLATLGRDHYVKIVEEGNLFPFGHRAAIVTVTERKFDKGTKAAVNKQRKYIVILEPEVTYKRNDPANKFIKFPFQEVKITTTFTPDIDKPSDSSLIDDNTHLGFLINVDNKGFKFDLIFTDKEGNEQYLSMPLAFVEDSVALNKTLISKVISNYHKTDKKSYTDIAFNGQFISYAKSLLEGDTSLETKTLQFGAMLYPTRSGNTIKFHPIMRSAKVYVDAIDKVTNVKKPLEISLEDDNNQGNIFAKVKEAVVDFTGNSGSSGGFVTPNMAVNALSKLQGAVGGTISDLKAMRFNPGNVFKELDNLPLAKIFGVIKLVDLFLDVNLGSSLTNFIKTVKRINDEIQHIKDQILFVENELLGTITDAEKIIKVAEKEGKEYLKQEKEALIKQAKKEAKEKMEDLASSLTSKVEDLLEAINDNTPKIPNLKTYFTENAFFAEYKFQPEFKGTSMAIIPSLLKVFVAEPKKAMSISTVVKKPFSLTEAPSVNTSARFNKFSIDIIPLLKINFNYLEFKSGSEVKTDVKVDMDMDNPIEFKGVLTFVNNLQSLIPSGGFSDDGPYIDLKPTGVKAGFNMSVPDVEVGVCMITNISLGAYVMLPFTGAPLTMGFNFCTRENPFLLTISCFGGGGYFMMVSTLEGIQSMEAAFEFGAAMSLNVGVASGSVTVMGGFYFKMELIEQDDDEVSQVTLSGYLRMNGRLSVIGLINVSIEFYLALDAVITNGKVDKMVGIATVKVKVEVLFFSKTVSVTVRREIQGADADPKFVEMIDQDDWQDYCLAFAG